MKKGYMQAWAITEYGDSGKVRLMELPLPVAGDDDVLIRVKAASINPIDYKTRSGKLKILRKNVFPLVLGHDCAGIVHQVGRNVSRFKAGDEVYVRLENGRIGAFAEFAVARASSVALKPASISFAEAASLPLVALTSWQVLLQEGRLQPGERVFIPGGAGGIGTFAIQLARHFGATVVSNASAGNIDFVHTLGADEVVDYAKSTAFDTIAPVDMVYDTQGGSAQRRAFGILKRGGRLISIMGPPTPRFIASEGGSAWLSALMALVSLPARWRARRHGAGYVFWMMRPDGAVLETIARLVDSQVIKPVVARSFAFADALQALALAEQGRGLRGKIVITL